MPAGIPIESPALPVTFRPWVSRWVLGVLAVAVTACMVVLAIVLPEPGATTDGFKSVDRIGFAVLAVIFLVGLGLLARPSIRADADGLLVINVGRRRRLAWAQVLAVRLRPGDAWLVLELADGTSLNAMGVQTSDGERARRAATQIAQLVAINSATPRND